MVTIGIKLAITRPVLNPKKISITANTIAIACKRLLIKPLILVLMYWSIEANLDTESPTGSFSLNADITGKTGPCPPGSPQICVRTQNRVGFSLPALGKGAGVK